MEISGVHPTSMNLDLSEALIIHWPLVLSCYQKDMYMAQHIKVSSKVMTDNMDSTKSILTTQGGRVSFVQNQRKENLLKTIYNAITNIIMEPFLRLPGSFTFNTNNPLSVTIVQNNGIISPEFFKGLMTRQETLISHELSTENVKNNKSVEIPKRIDDMVLKQKTSTILDTFDVDFNKKTEHVVSCKTNDLHTSVQNQWLPDYTMDTNVIGTMCKDDVSIVKEEKVLDSCSNMNTIGKDNLNTDTSLNLITPLTQSQTENTSTRATDTGILSCVWKKVMTGISDSFNFKTVYVDTETEHIATKRVYSPRQRRKLNTIAKGRRRGRAKSQLRHSGVSQTRHRKERKKHELDNDIQDELDIWERSNKIQNNNSWSNNLEDDEIPIEETFTPTQITLGDIKPEKEKVKAKKVINHKTRKSPSRIYELQEDIDVVDSIQSNERYKIDSRNAFRPRLLSESSVDSEDSYCIVFETESENTYKSDFDYSEVNESSDESRCEDDFDIDQNENNCAIRKVTFDLKPVVHTMVQWDFAYRAARRGPWEEMARDRERFKGRIYYTKCILDPILEIRHRTHIWEERFA